MRGAVTSAMRCVARGCAWGVAIRKQTNAVISAHLALERLLVRVLQGVRAQVLALRGSVVASWVRARKGPLPVVASHMANQMRPGDGTVVTAEDLALRTDVAE